MNQLINTLSDELMQRPSVCVLVNRLQKRIEAEREGRQHFYEIVEENKKMEFINGEIYFHSPVMLRHNKANGLLWRLLSTYVDSKQLGFVGIEKILVSLTRNDYEPDICFFLQEKAQHFLSNQRQFPAPDFVVEVLSPSTEYHDRNLKMEDYAAHGVAEYWIIDPDKQIIEQYCLNDAQVYELQIKASTGNISSQVITGFTIPIKAVFEDAANLAAMQKLL